jgi:hypothetical protein
MLPFNSARKTYTVQSLARAGSAIFAPMNNEKALSPEEQARAATHQANIHASIPPEALELLRDPRLDTLKTSPKGLPPASLAFQPEPVRTDSSYLQIVPGFTSRPDQGAHWVNRPQHFHPFGGKGFKPLPERPRIEHARKAPQQLFHWTEFNTFYVASPDVVEILRRKDADAIVTIPIDWVYSDGQGLDGYVFLDIVRHHHLYDYKRSTVYVEKLETGVRRPRLGYDRALRDDIPPAVEIVRDRFMRHEAFVSRALAEQLYPLTHRELDFRDVHTHERVPFPLPKGRRQLLARLKPAEVIEENASMPLERRMSLRIMPLLHRGAIAEAEATLVSWLAAEPASPYHIIADLRITNDPLDCARYFDAFHEKASGEGPPTVVYTEMNGFTVNPDLWFCDAFGFPFQGDTESFDWLGSFHASTDEHYVIDGLEDLQRVFLEDMESGRNRHQHANARYLAVALVIVKFQRLMQSARAHMKQLKGSLLASAHDYVEFVVEIKPAP